VFDPELPIRLFLDEAQMIAFRSVDIVESYILAALNIPVRSRAFIVEIKAFQRNRKVLLVGNLPEHGVEVVWDSGSRISAVSGVING
jgi:hypothetical protein